MRSVEESNIHMAKPTCHNIKMQDVICHVSQCHITISYLHVRCDVGKMLLNTYMMWNDNAWMQRSLKNADPPKPLISPMQENMCFFPRASERRVLPIVGVCISSSHLHTFSSSHLLIFTPSLTPSHLHICSSSHLLIFTSAHLHICSSSHLLSHLLIFTSAHLHICSSSHLLLFTPSLTPSHLHTFSHIFSSSHLLSLTLSPLSSLLSLSPFSLSFLSPFSLSRLLYLSLFRPRVVPAGSHETSTLSHEMRVDRQKLR